MSYTLETTRIEQGQEQETTTSTISYAELVAIEPYVGWLANGNPWTICDTDQANLTAFYAGHTHNATTYAAWLDS